MAKDLSELIVVELEDNDFVNSVMENAGARQKLPGSRFYRHDNGETVDVESVQLVPSSRLMIGMNMNAARSDGGIWYDNEEYKAHGRPKLGIPEGVNALLLIPSGSLVQRVGIYCRLEDGDGDSEARS